MEKIYKITLSLFFYLSVVNITKAQSESIIINISGGDASSNFNLPAKLEVNSFTGPLRTFSGSNNKPETGAPAYSSQVDAGATFYAINGGITGFPTRIGNNNPLPNRTGASSFVAIKEDNEGNKRIWINMTVGAFRISGTTTFNWEYQLRYFEDTKTKEKRAILGTVTNSGNFAGQSVNVSLESFPDFEVLPPTESNIPAKPDSIVAYLSGGEAAKSFHLPTTLKATSFTGPFTFFNGSNNKPETGSPVYSSEVEDGATFYIINGVIQGFPNRVNTSDPFPNRSGGSSFIAIKEDDEGNRKIWINLSVGAFKISGGFTYNWEYQFRYFEDTKTRERRSTLGVVANAGFYFGQPVEATLNPIDNLYISLFHQLKDKTNKPKGTESLFEIKELNKPDIGALETKITADGSEVTKIKIKGEEINSYKIEIQGSDKELVGELLNPIYKGNELVVEYKHPLYFKRDKTLSSYPVYFTIKKNNVQKHTFELKIVRPSMIMVHGIFGNRETFEDRKSVV